jgi:hypothetical protein
MPITLLLVAAASAVVSSVVTYLFLRANPNKRAKLDALTDKAKDQLKDLEQ